MGNPKGNDLGDPGNDLCSLSGFIYAVLLFLSLELHSLEYFPVPSAASPVSVSSCWRRGDVQGCGFCFPTVFLDFHTLPLLANTTNFALWGYRYLNPFAAARRELLWLGSWKCGMVWDKRDVKFLQSYPSSPTPPTIPGFSSLALDTWNKHQP